MKSKYLLVITLFILSAHILFAATPVISSFSPSSGSVGTLVTINGSNLGSPTAFSIGGTTAIVVSITSTQLVGMVMPGAVSGTVSLTTAQGIAVGSSNFTVTTTLYPNIQQGSKLVGTGNIGPANQGSVAISADGNTAVVGGASDNSSLGFGSGAIWIYTRNGNIWQQQGSKLIGSGSIGPAQQGFSVAISADGNTVLEGARSDNNSQGAVWIFNRNNGIWTQQGPKLTVNDNNGAASFGWAVSLSADGNTAVIGGKTDNNSRGAAWIFNRTGNTWAQQGPKLVDISQPLVNNQGYSVAISADGITAVIGELGNVTTGGALCVYTRIGNNWIQQGPKFTGMGAVAVGSNTAQQGWSVAISADGNTVIEGGNNDNTGVGAAWIFFRSGNNWIQQGEKLVGTGNVGRSFQGESVAISADGNIAIVGGPSDNSSHGAMWIFKRTANTWAQQGIKISGSNYIGPAFQGAVSISADGNTAIMGGSQDNNSQGAAWVFSTLSSITVNSQVAPTKQNAIKYNSNQLTAAEPIQLGTGSYEYTHTDFRLHTVKDSLNFTRYYNSLNDSISSPMGYGWSHSYNYQLTVQKDSSSRQDLLWTVKYPDGHIAAFIPLNGSTGQSIPLYTGTQDSLKKDSAGDFTMFTKDNHQYHFTRSGVLDQVSDLNGNQTKLNYSGNNLSSVVGQGGRTLTFTYSGSNITSVTDPLNRTCSFTYDVSGNLQTAKDANGNPTTFTYDANHRMLAAVNPLGNVIVKNTYDTTGRVVSQMDAYSQPTTIAYNLPSIGDVTVTNPDNSQFIAHHDSSFRKTYIKDELGLTKTYAYDGYSNENSFTDENGQNEARQFDKLGNLLIRTQPGGASSQITYNAFNSPLQVTDPNGNVTTFTYDANDNLVSMLLPDKTVQQFTYYPNGLRNTFKDGRGNLTTYTYSTNGDLLSSTSFNGAKTYAYDAAGRRITSTDENNNTSKIAYDNNDNIVSITDALNQSTLYTYDANNQLISITDKTGSITTYTYDKKGRMVTKTDVNGGVIKNAYDTRDNLVSVTDQNGNLISYTYDKKGRRTGITNAVGSTQNQFDGAGNLTEVIDATNKTTTYTYTSTYKTKTISDGLNNTTNYSYDKNNNLVSLTDPLSKTTAYTYDAMNRLISVLDAANNTTKITYDENGNKKTVTDPNGHTQTYTYDAANRLTGYLDAAANTINYTYDAASNITLITKPTGTIAKTYDALNRLVSATNSTGDKYNYTYDKNDNIISMGSGAGTSYLSYDKLNHLVQYADPFNQKVAFGYDAAGNKQSITYPGNKTVNYTYDNVNNLKKVSDWLSHTFSYSYDAAGRTTQLVYPNGIHCDYVFDAAGRLTSKKNGGTGSTVVAASIYTLDAVGNRTTEQKLGASPSNLVPATRVYTYGNDDRLLKDSVWTYLNDNSGNRASETKGNIKATYTFSVDDRLSKMVDTIGTTSTFLYDAQGRRLGKSAGNINARYVLDISGSLPQVLQITDGSGVIISQFVYGAGLLERVDSTGNALYYQFDGQHNTVALTDANAVVTDTYTYDPFGTLLLHKGNTIQPFTFLGEFGVEQENSSIYYVRARYYDSANSRFLSKDSYPYSLLNSQNINRYSYSTNNPLARYDYNGFYGNQDSGVKSYRPSLGQTANVSSRDNIGSIENDGREVVNVITEVASTAHDVLDLFKFGKSSSFVGENGGVIISGLSTGADIYNILVNKQTSKSNYFNLTFDSSTTALGIAIGAGIITSPVIIYGLAVGGIIYGGANIYSEIKYRRSISERLFGE